MKSIVALAAVLALSTGACREAEPSPARVILSGAAGERLLRPCSRQGVAGVQGLWTPSLRQVAQLEAALPGALAQHPPALPPDSLVGQYTGFVRRGRRYVYGSFFPRLDARGRSDSVRLDTVMPRFGTPNPLRWREQPMWTCHGGRYSFGIEYSLDSGQVEKVTFDVAGPPGP